MLASTVFLLTAATLSSVRETVNFNETGPVPLAVLELLSTDEISLAFKIEPIPDQAMLLYRAGPADFSQQVKVRKSGKGSYSLKLGKLPTALAALSPDGLISLSLLLASAGEITPLSIPLGQIQLPDTVIISQAELLAQEPKAWERERYSLMKELHWTFRQPEKGVGKVKVVIGTLAVLAPYLLFIALFAIISPSFATPTINLALFVISVAALEGLIITYWVGLKLLPTMKYFVGLSVWTAWIGRRALSDMRVRREAKALGAKKAQ